ncbi:hypothetical protein SAMN05216327_12311 [Dyadobacter sp. SG02]|nr:hypothetical protein SAMN05216327_12311 [Dyadobacter sp. SG02]
MRYIPSQEITGKRYDMLKKQPGNQPRRAVRTSITMCYIRYANSLPWLIQILQISANPLQTDIAGYRTFYGMFEAKFVRIGVDK